MEQGNERRSLRSKEVVSQKEIKDEIWPKNSYIEIDIYSPRK